MTPPREFSALPPRDSGEASPKAISGRTSYLRVRLEFLPYPRLLATLFNGCAFGPPPPFTAASAWTRIDHPVSGTRRPTVALFTLGFPPAPPLKGLNLAGRRDSPDRSTKSTRSRLPRSRSLRTQGFRFSFTPLPGSFSPFLHSTLLYRSPGSIQPCGVVPAPSHRVPRVPWYSGSRRSLHAFAYGALTLSRRSSQFRSAGLPFPSGGPYPGALRAPVWAPPLSLAATHGIDVSFSSSGYLDVSVRRVPPAPLLAVPRPLARGGRVLPGRVSPFRHLRVTGHLPLAAAFRSLSRLSSAPGAKASSLRLVPLNLAPAAHSVARRGFSHYVLSVLLFLGCLLNTSSSFRQAARPPVRTRDISFSSVFGFQGATPARRAGWA